MCVWVEDADKLSIDSAGLEIVYTNRAISSYLLRAGNSLGIVGVKGQGKTFLIKVKRKRITDDKIAICLPYEKMVDTIDNSIVIHPSLYKSLNDYSTWVKLWKFAISSTILTARDVGGSLRTHILKNRTLEVLGNINNVRAEPTVVLKELLRLEIKDFLYVLEDTSILFDALKDVRTSVCVFFDKIDQGFSTYAKDFNEVTSMPKKSRNASYWQYAQYSLAESAYDIYTNANQHIKVYYTIRQEACIDCEYLNKDKARNINAFMTVIKYSKNDLREMYNLYIKNEEKRNLVKDSIKNEKPSEAFLGLEEMEHGYVKDKVENVFDYIYRHTFKRPYDIMLICKALYSEISEKDKEIDRTKAIRHIVNMQSTILLKRYLEELSIFLPFDTDIIFYMAKMFTGNILSEKLVKDICFTFDQQQMLHGIWSCNEQCNICTNLYPFSVLYNLGLIGCERKHEADSEPKIYFENIGSSILDMKAHILPASAYYYLHPALSNTSRDKRHSLGLKYNTCSCMIIGDGYAVDSLCVDGLKKNTRQSYEMFKKEKVFVSSTIYDLKREREKVREIIKNRGLYPVMSDYEFDIRNMQKVHSHDHCLDEVKKCKSLVFIIGSEYGGIYKGNKYIKERDEIISLSEGKIKEPSISLMEYYVARKKGVKCYAFISEKNDNAYRKKELQEEMRREINFLNHFHDKDDKVKGNWILRYNNLGELSRKLCICRFG